MSYNKMEVGIIGSGRSATIHAEAYSQIPGVKMKAVASRTQDNASRFARQYKIHEVYASYTEMLDKETFDIVDICTPNYLHAPMTVYALEKGCNVLCEKPIALSLDDADKMIDCANRTNRKLMIAHPYRFDPLHRRIHQEIEEGNIGTPVLLRATKWVSAKWLTPENWFTQIQKSGGMIIDTCIHHSDLMRWYLFDEPETVYAQTGQLVKKEWESEDTVVILYRFKKGAIASLECTWAAPQGLPTRRDVSGHVEIMGTKGSLKVDDVREPLDLTTDEKFTYLHVESEKMYTKEIEHFTQCVRENREPEFDPGEARKALEMLVGASKSAKSNKVIRFPI